MRDDYHEEGETDHFDKTATFIVLYVIHMYLYIKPVQSALRERPNNQKSPHLYRLDQNTHTHTHTLTNSNTINDIDMFIILVCNIIVAQLNLITKLFSYRSN